MKDKNWTSDRVLVLRPMEGKKPLNTLGASDPRLFTGENVVHAIMDKQTSLWYIRYSRANPPPKLRNKYTNFSKLLQAARDYFSARNIDIIEVKNAENSYDR